MVFFYSLFPMFDTVQQPHRHVTGALPCYYRFAEIGRFRRPESTESRASVRFATAPAQPVRKFLTVPVPTLPVLHYTCWSRLPYTPNIHVAHPYCVFPQQLLSRDNGKNIQTIPMPEESVESKNPPISFGGFFFFC